MFRVLRGPCLAILVFLGLAAAALAAPKIEIEPPRLDVGTVTNQGTLAREFTVRNRGDAELRIRRVTTGCASCLQARLDHQTLAPDTETTLRCRLDLGPLSGPFSRTVTLESNDPDNPAATIELAGAVAALWQIEPAEFLLAPAEGQTTAVVRITALLPRRAPLSLARADVPGVETALKPGQTPDDWLLEVRATARLPRGRTSILLTLSGADPRDPSCTVRGKAHCPTDLEVLPSRLSFRRQPGPQTRILWLRQHGKSTLELLDVIPPDQAFRCEMERCRDVGSYRIYVTLTAPPATNDALGPFVLKLREVSGQEQTFEVPASLEPPETKPEPGTE